MTASNEAPVHQQVLGLSAWMNRQIVGQSALVSRLLIALLADGHLLVEGSPGLAKTRAVRALAQGIEGNFQRIQFTPDLLPSDLTGTDIYRPQDSSFSFHPGPLFHEIIVADEINRAPARVQSALLEAMEERQITVGGKTFPLASLFLVMATQNPLEQEGTYPLPEAQLDRFIMKVTIGYPSLDSELQIMRQVRSEAQQQQSRDQADSRGAVLTDGLPLSQASVQCARQQVLQLHMAPAVEEYIAQLVRATREPENWSADLQRWIRFGASPRASLALDRCSRALAWLEGRDFVTPEDVQLVAHDVLRHRVLTSYRADVDGVPVDDIISQVLSLVAVP